VPQKTLERLFLSAQEGILSSRSSLLITVKHVVFQPEERVLYKTSLS